MMLKKNTIKWDTTHYLNLYEIVSNIFKRKL
jgi:hypothetical protein